MELNKLPANARPLRRSSLWSPFSTREYVSTCHALPSYCLRWKRSARQWIGVCAALFSSACGPETARDVLEDYSQRVHNALDLDPPSPYAHTLPSYPRHRDLHLDLRDVRIGLLELVSLQRCGLEELVAARNSGLGKVMPPSQQLLYEHRLLSRARVCVDMLRSSGEEPELLARLLEVVEIKERDISRAYWNATFASGEFAEHFSLATQPLPIKQEQDPTPQWESLYYLRDVAAQLGRAESAVDTERLERCFFYLQSRSYGGQLLLSVDALTFYLQAVAAAIETRQREQNICPQGVPTPRAKIMQTVFLKFYAAETQPYLARVHREGRAWLDAIDGLADVQSEIPASFASYRALLLAPRQEASSWARFETAIQRHTQAWQALFDQCGMNPLNPPVEES